MRLLTFNCEEYNVRSDPSFDDHLALLKLPENIGHSPFKLKEIRITPHFSISVRYQLTKRISSQLNPFPQYSLLAYQIDSLSKQTSRSATRKGEPIYRPMQDPHIFLNIGVPHSIFSCGSQGSSKSHSLSCVLENCLIPNSSATQLANPLTGLVFYYHSFASAVAGQAYLCSSEIEVTVLVSPSNLTRIISIYQNLPRLTAGRPRVEPLLLQQRYRPLTQHPGYDDPLKESSDVIGFLARHRYRFLATDGTDAPTGVIASFRLLTDYLIPHRDC